MLKISIFASCLFFVPGNVLGEISSADQQKSEESFELTRKFDTAAFFKSVAKTCERAGDLAGAQTQDQKKEAACDLVGAVCETAAVLSEKTKPRSLGYEYLQEIRALPTEKEQQGFIAKILNNKEECEFFLNELFSLVKVLLIDLFPGDNGK